MRVLALMLMLAVPGAAGMLAPTPAAAAAAAARTPFQIRCEDTISKTISVLSSKNNGFTINNQLPYRALTLKTGSIDGRSETCLLYTSPSPRDRQKSRMPSSA